MTMHARIAGRALGLLGLLFALGPASCGNEETGGSGGSGGSADLCGGVVCNSPPADECADAATLRRYGAGSCQSGHCTYPDELVPCANGCEDGECVDACAGCAEAPCGANGCTESCGTCPVDEWCLSGTCGDPYPDKRVGIFYLAWHAYASDAIRKLPDAERYTVEDVVRDPSLSFGDMLLRHGLTGEAAAFHYHVRPELGFYCLYQRRPNEAPYAEPDYVDDCPDVATVAAQHATQLWSAGIDFVYLDATNLPFASPFADVLGLRPIEVLLEQWSALRQAGTITPQLAVWVPIPPKQPGQEGLTYLAEQLLELYNRPELDELILEHRPTGKKVMFITDHAGLPADAAELALLEDNGGRHDVVAVKLWGLTSAQEFAEGKASWMQPCVTVAGEWTTLIDADVPCAQGYTQTSPIGTVLSVSSSYQLGYASLPFHSSGKNDGLTLARQFETAFAVQPDYLLINSWNELVAQPQPNPHYAALGSVATSMGEPGPAPPDESTPWLWVDPYGAELVRDIEPTVEYGSQFYDLTASCIRVLKAGTQGCAAPAAAAEACCQVGQQHVLVHSLRGIDPSDSMSTHHVLTTAIAERDALLSAGGWEQVCNVGYAPPGLCAASTDLGADGPFLLFVNGGPDRVALQRCWSGVANFFSLDPGCEGREVVGQLGYLSTARNTHSPRPLVRCYNAPAQVHFHWLGEACPAGFEDGPVLGYVR